MIKSSNLANGCLEIPIAKKTQPSYNKCSNSIIKQWMVNKLYLNTDTPKTTLVSFWCHY